MYYWNFVRYGFFNFRMCVWECVFGDDCYVGFDIICVKRKNCNIFFFKCCLCKNKFFDI